MKMIKKNTETGSRDVLVLSRFLRRELKAAVESADLTVQKLKTLRHPFQCLWNN